MPNTKNMHRLRAAAARFDAESGRVNDLILDFERQVADAGVGLSQWLERIQHDEPWFEGWLVGFREQRTRHGDLITAHGWQIGYSEIGSEWRVAARQVVVAWWGPHDHAVSIDGPCIPLLKAPRHVRVAAFVLLGALADALTARMEKYSDAIATTRENDALRRRFARRRKSRKAKARRRAEPTPVTARSISATSDDGTCTGSEPRSSAPNS